MDLDWSQHSKILLRFGHGRQVWMTGLRGAGALPGWGRALTADLFHGEREQ